MHCRQMDLTHSGCLQAHVADWLRRLSNDSYRKEKKKNQHFTTVPKLIQDNLFFFGYIVS